VRFVCSQHEPLVVATNPVTHQKTLLLWERDVCEIFIAPDPLNPGRYFEFEAAPTGEWVDLGIILTPAGRKTAWDFASGKWTAKISVTDACAIDFWGDRIAVSYPTFVEVFYMKRAACLWRGRIDVDANGDVEVPQGPGIGYEPDKAVMEQYRVS